MSKWNHNICAHCWNEKNPNRDPVNMKVVVAMRCCYCGQYSKALTMIKENPEKVRCQGKHE